MPAGSHPERSERPNRFVCASSRSLRRAGLVGSSVDVAVGRNDLQLAGAGGGLCSIPYHSIARLRVERVEGKGAPVFSAYVTRSSGKSELRLLPLRDQRPVYAAAVRALAEHVQRVGGPGRVVCGQSKRAALAMPALSAAAVLGACVFALDYEYGVAWWEPLCLIAAAIALCAFFCWEAITRSWPKPRTSLEVFDHYLPC